MKDSVLRRFDSSFHAVLLPAIGTRCPYMYFTGSIERGSERDTGSKRRPYKISTDSRFFMYVIAKRIKRDKERMRELMKE